MTCPGCGAPVAPTSRFCEHCGVALFAAPAAPLPPQMPLYQYVPPPAPKRSNKKVIAIVVACLVLNPFSLGLMAGLVAFAVGAGSSSTTTTKAAAQSTIAKCQSEAQTFEAAFQAFRASHNGESPGAENGAPSALGVICDLMHAGLIARAPKLLDGAASTTASWQSPKAFTWAFDPATGRVYWFTC